MNAERARDIAADQFWWRADAVCGEAPLTLVDAAYRSPGSLAGMRFRDRYCARCPVQALCLAEAMETGEAGVWGGTGPNHRTHAGSPTFRRSHPDPERLRRH